MKGIVGFRAFVYGAEDQLINATITTTARENMRRNKQTINVIISGLHKVLGGEVTVAMVLVRMRSVCGAGGV